MPHAALSFPGPVRKLGGDEYLRDKAGAIELPGIVHRVPGGHGVHLVLTSTDAAHKNAYTVQPVTVSADLFSPAALRIPVVR